MIKTEKQHPEQPRIICQLAFFLDKDDNIKFFLGFLSFFTRGRDREKWDGWVGLLAFGFSLIIKKKQKQKVNYDCIDVVRVYIRLRVFLFKPYIFFVHPNT